MTGIPLRTAAKQLGLDVSTLQRDVRNGCPAVHLGSVGRGRGTLVNLVDVQRWRSTRAGGAAVERSDDAFLQLISTALWDCLKRDDLAGRLGLTDKQAAGAMVLVYERLFKTVKHESLTSDHLPAEMQHACAIYLQSRHDEHERKD